MVSCFGRLRTLIVSVAALGLAVALCGGGHQAAQALGYAEVTIADGAFQPASILMQAGDTVVWTNTGTVAHTVTADDGSFDSGPLAPGAGFHRSFPTAGLVTYHCALHHWMRGAVTFTQAPAAGSGGTVNRLPGAGVGNAAAGAPRLLALVALLVATGLGSRAILGRRGARPAAGELVAVVFLALAPLLQLAPSASAAQAGSGPETLAIPPVVWQLVGVAEANGAPVTIDDPTRYTVQFLPDGGLLARFDCNQGSGDYTAVEGVLALTPPAVTTEPCSADSFGETFQRLLEQATAYRFDPEAGHLVLRGEAGALDLQPALTGVVWQWQGTVSNAGEVTVQPDEPARYAVEFLPDGALAIQADCNRATGVYSVAGAHIDVQIGGVTRMACPPGSLMDQFLAELDRAVSYTIQQTLSLALDGGGVMRFAAVVGVPASETPPAG